MDEVWVDGRNNGWGDEGEDGGSRNQKRKIIECLTDRCQTFGFSSMCKGNHGRIFTRGSSKVKITFFKDYSVCLREEGAKAEAKESREDYHLE